MSFFGLGWGEILLIFIVALLIFGPGKVPEMARTLGRAVRGFRKATSDFTAAMTKELSVEEKDHPPQSRAISDGKTEESSPVSMAESSSSESTGSRDQ